MKKIGHEPLTFGYSVINSKSIISFENNSDIIEYVDFHPLTAQILSYEYSRTEKYKMISYIIQETQYSRRVNIIYAKKELL